MTENIKFSGRILFLTEDTSLIRRQLAATGDAAAQLESELAERLKNDDLPLMSNISTDEITPGWVCFYYDETLGQYVYVGMREGAVQKDEVKNGGFAVVVSGLSKGCGSSRETAPYAEKAAGVQLVIAKSIEKIYGQNSQNIGLLTSTDFSLIDRIRGGEEIPLTEFTKGLDPISQDIVRHGGLFNYNKARLAGRVSPPPNETAPRPMTIVEKIIARHAFVTAGKIGVEAVKPGDALFAVADVRFSHEYVTPMAESLFVAEMGKDAKVTDPESVWAFRDHLTFLDLVMPKAHKDMG
ncbi:MAG TPA: hypothetical protein VFT26_11990, partial [Pyrinomonadaceae bacterium]|nr:hypothetical protein [Pyrinomonadaceae bacterium]